MTRTRIAEIMVALFMIAAAGAMLFAGRSLAANPFEPIGSGTIPNAVAWITLALASALLVSGRWASGAYMDAATEDAEPWLPLLAVAGMTIAYVLVLASGSVRYQWVTFVFLVAVILTLSPDRRRAWPWAVGVAAAFAFGLDYLFRHVLVADIP
ncbi:MAG: tripartite tricarboxylate transporter TctB family protein [Hyphomicrobiaceae bacterium]